MRFLLCATALFTIAACAPQSAGTVSPGSPQAPPPAATQSQVKTATWGERYTWPDGLAVEVSAPKPCKPGQHAMPPNIQRAIMLTLRVVNGTDKTVNPGALTFGTDAQFAGKKAETVYGSDDGNCGDSLESATLLPGKEFTVTVAFAVDKAPGELQVALQPTLMAEKAIYVGTA